MSPPTQKYSRFWTRFDVWYVGLTTIYSLLVLTGSGYLFEGDAGERLGNPFVNFIGIFVPVGPNNYALPIFYLAIILEKLGLTISPLAIQIIGLIIIASVCLAIAIWLEKINHRVFTPWKKILFNLAILFLLTTLVTGPFSLYIFWHSLTQTF